MWGLCASKNNMCCGRDVATDWFEFPNRKTLKFAEKEASACIWNSVSSFVHSLMTDSTVSVPRPGKTEFCPVCYNREERFQKSMGYSSLRVLMEESENLLKAKGANVREKELLPLYKHQ